MYKHYSPLIVQSCDRVDVSGNNCLHFCIALLIKCVNARYFNMFTYFLQLIILTCSTSLRINTALTSADIDLDC